MPPPFLLRLVSLSPLQRHAVQHGGGGGCRGHSCRRCTANALPAAAATAATTAAAAAVIYIVIIVAVIVAVSVIVAATASN